MNVFNTRLISRALEKRSAKKVREVGQEQDRIQQRMEEKNVRLGFIGNCFIFRLSHDLVDRTKIGNRKTVYFNHSEEESVVRRTN